MSAHEMRQFNACTCCQSGSRKVNRGPEVGGDVWAADYESSGCDLTILHHTSQPEAPHITPCERLSPFPASVAIRIRNKVYKVKNKVS